MPAAAARLLNAPQGPVPFAPVLPGAVPSWRGVLGALVAQGAMDHDNMLAALADLARSSLRPAESLLARRLVHEADLYRAIAQVWDLAPVDPSQDPPDPRLIDLAGAEDCLSGGFLPWKNLGAVTVILTAYPEEIARHRARLTALYGPVRFALCPYRLIEASVHAQRGRGLARRAETRLDSADSCRNWAGAEAKVLSRALIAVAIAALLFPRLAFDVALVLVLAGLVPVTGLKLAALAAQMLTPRASARPAAPLALRRPVVSIIVALYREGDIAGRLVRRLGRLEYPHDLLDVILAVEEDDAVTRQTIARTNLPPWMRVAVVPRGKIKTKPRALNFALNLCRGAIIGVYDAEDAPEPDQISKVVQRFHERGPKVACLQGILDFYNPNQNWLARCFTLEYGGWFRVILPGLARLGMPIPLGGTTLFFRREALLALGGWDAHNVTEDADLGMRLARRGYRTELIETTTYEEANCRALPWVKQRSRWIKGYMMTYAVHMRRPLHLLRALGPAGFAGFQILLLGSMVQVLLAPVLWATALFSLLPFLSASPFEAGLLALMLPLTLGTELVSIAVLALGRRRSGQAISWLWIPSLTLYFPLAALASYKALWEAVVQPFYWDKTVHGHLSGSASLPRRSRTGGGA